jgi:hypothetical protein
MNKEMRKDIITKKQGTNRKFLRLFACASLVIVSWSLVIVSPALAQPAGSADPNNSAFRLSVCDGPAELNQIDPKTGQINPALKNDPKFIPCNFQGLMIQVQHLINIMITVGVFAAIIGFSYAGYLYITGVPGNITKAHEIFKKVGIGFIIMLSAWFIVYQILAWFTGNSGLKALLGTP